jgi:hypothetical protein
MTILNINDAEQAIFKADSDNAYKEIYERPPNRECFFFGNHFFVRYNDALICIKYGEDFGNTSPLMGIDDPTWRVLKKDYETWIKDNKGQILRSVDIDGVENKHVIGTKTNILQRLWK